MQNHHEGCCKHTEHQHEGCCKGEGHLLLDVDQATPFIEAIDTVAHGHVRVKPAS